MAVMMPSGEILRGSLPDGGDTWVPTEVVRLLSPPGRDAPLHLFFSKEWKRDELR